MATKADIQSTSWTLDLNNPGKIVQGTDDIKQCVLIILTTEKGSDPLRPDFGCSAYDHIDKPINRAVSQMVKSMFDALTKYEPRIDNIKISVVSSEQGNATFTVSYGIKNTTENDKLNVTYGRGT